MFFSYLNDVLPLQKVVEANTTLYMFLFFPQMIVAVFFVSWPEEGDFQHRSTSAQEEGEGNALQTTSNNNIIACEILKN